MNKNLNSKYFSILLLALFVLGGTTYSTSSDIDVNATTQSIINSLKEAGCEFIALSEQEEAIKLAVSRIKKALSDPTTINDLDEHGFSAMHYAAYYLPSIVATLVEEGADVNATASGKRSQESPLHCAAKSFSPDSVQILLKKGANPNVTSDDGKTPLEVLLSFLKNDEDKDRAVKLFLSYGAKLDPKKLTKDQKNYLLRIGQSLSLRVVCQRPDGSFVFANRRD